MSISPDTLDRIAQSLTQTDLAARALARLNACGVRWVAVKGLALMAQKIPGADQRPLADFDLWVEPEDLDVAIHSVEAEGFQRIAGGQHGFRRVRGRSVAQIELHPSLDGLTDRAQCSIWDRTETAQLESSALPGVSLEVRVPNPIDHFLLIAHHALVGHGTLRDYWRNDLIGLVQHGLDPHDLRCRARELELGAVLAMVADLLESDHALPREFPSQVWEELSPSEIRRAELLTALRPRREIPDLGHVLHWIAAPSWRHRIQSLRQKIWPDRDFLDRRLQAELSPEEDSLPAVRARWIRWVASLRAVGSLGQRWLHDRERPS